MGIKTPLNKGCFKRAVPVGSRKVLFERSPSYYPGREGGTRSFRDLGLWGLKVVNSRLLLRPIKFMGFRSTSVYSRLPWLGH